MVSALSLILTFYLDPLPTSLTTPFHNTKIVWSVSRWLNYFGSPKIYISTGEQVESLMNFAGTVHVFYLHTVLESVRSKLSINTGSRTM